MALLDTGASGTCIDVEAAKEIQLPIIDHGLMMSASHTQIPCNIYPVQIELVGFKIKFNVARCAGASLNDQQLVLLIGRDVLAMCTLFYNGGAGQITLSI